MGSSGPHHRLHLFGSRDEMDRVPDIASRHILIHEDALSIMTSLLYGAKLSSRLFSTSRLEVDQAQLYLLVTCDLSSRSPSVSAQFGTGAHWVPSVPTARATIDPAEAAPPPWSLTIGRYRPSIGASHTSGMNRPCEASRSSNIVPCPSIDRARRM